MPDNEEDAHPCDCDVCVYSREVERVAGLQPRVDLKKFVDDLYWRYAMEMDDAGMMRSRWRDVKPLIHELRALHFKSGSRRSRLAGHAECKSCEILERNT